MTIPIPAVPHPTTACTIDYLERRSSYMAKVPYQQRRPVKQKISDAAMHLSPATWFTPAILRAHDAHEYKKDRKRLEQQYEAHRHEQSLKRRDNYHPGEYEDGFPPPPASFRTVTMSSSSTLTAVPGRASAVGVRSEMCLPRARALEWAGTTSVFSPGVLQEWMMMDGGLKDYEDDYEMTFGPDPWALPPIEDFRE